MSETNVPPATLATIRGHLDAARGQIEGSASSAPAAIDGGDMTPLLANLLSRLTDNAATLSEGLSVVSQQVGATEADFWSVDSDISTSFGGPHADQPGRPHAY